MCIGAMPPVKDKVLFASVFSTGNLKVKWKYILILRHGAIVASVGYFRAQAALIVKLSNRTERKLTSLKRYQSSFLYVSTFQGSMILSLNITYFCI